LNTKHEGVFSLGLNGLLYVVRVGAVAVGVCPNCCNS